MDYLQISTPVRPYGRRAAALGRPAWGLTERLRAGVSVETIVYLLIFVAAVLTRYWDLGFRALHHDESLHTYYSWRYAEGFGYDHNPLMHGPFLFHANALLYLLFGTSDFVSRVMPATAGVIVVMLPWLLRGRVLLGRWGALLASALLLVSPSILFYSRFIRHDLYALVGTFALFIAIVRYVERPQPRWAVLGGAATGFLFTTKEVSFISLFVFATLIGVVIARRSAPILLGIAGLSAVLLAGIAKLLAAAGMPPLPGIPWQNPDGQDIFAFVVDLILHPLVVAGIGVLLLSLVAALWFLARRRDPDSGWIDGILGDAPAGSASAALRELLIERRGMVGGVVAGATIFVMLYSSLFTNLGGLASGTFGALGYWLGQHGVQRGEQPWFYYLLLLPQYEFVGVLLFLPVAAWVVVCQVRAWQAGVDPSQRVVLRTFLVYWAALMLAVLSWAGEKMPWLLVHIALPLILLAASCLGEAAERVERAWQTWTNQERRLAVLLGAQVLVLSGAGFLAMAWASAGPYVGTGGEMHRTIRPEMADRWWLLYIPWLGILGILLAGIVGLGRRRALVVCSIAAVLALSLGQVHVAWRMTYAEGDVPKDMLIYVQSSPDVTRVVGEIERFSHQLTGGMGMEVWYDSGTQWPFNWYLRNFPNRRFFGEKLSETPDAPVVLVSREFLTADMEEKLRGYTYQEYSMRWWFPEEATYRRFAIAPELNNEARQNYQTNQPPPYSAGDVLRSVWSSIWAMREPEQQAKMFRLVTYRELPASIGSYTFRIYVRNDLLPEFNTLRYR